MKGQNLERGNRERQRDKSNLRGALAPPPPCKPWTRGETLLPSRGMSRNKKGGSRVGGDEAMYLGKGHGPVLTTLPKDISRRNHLSIDLEVFDSTDSKTLDQEAITRPRSNHSTARRPKITPHANGQSLSSFYHHHSTLLGALPVTPDLNVL